MSSMFLVTFLSNRLCALYVVFWYFKYTRVPMNSFLYAHAWVHCPRCSHFGLLPFETSFLFFSDLNILKPWIGLILNGFSTRFKNQCSANIFTAWGDGFHTLCVQIVARLENLSLYTWLVFLRFCLRCDRFSLLDNLD